MSGNQVNTQDWETKVIRKKPTGSSSSNMSEHEKTKALKEGNLVVKNKNSNIDNSNKLRKLDSLEEPEHRPEVTTEFKVALGKARLAANKTQAQLAQQLMCKPVVIADYESGKLVPEPDVIVKLNRLLNTKLPKAVSKK